MRAERRAQRTEARLTIAARLAMTGLLATASLLAGCARVEGPPRIPLGAPCVACGMAIQDLRFACARVEGRGSRYYDSIECLVRDAGAARGAGVYLADYDERAVHPADSLWVVRGSFPSPMGGGLAAFRRMIDAQAVAAQTRGRVARLADLMGGRR